MELILLIIYSIIVWFIFFKKKWLPWNITSQVIVVTIPIICLATIILFMNIVAPSSGDVRAMNYVIPISPRVTGEVTEVPIEPNRPIKKGDVLFKVDPVPFEAAAKAAEATLRRSGGSAQERRGQKGRADSADRPGEKARRAIHCARGYGCRETGRPRTGAKRSRKSRERISRGRRHGIAGQSADCQVRTGPLECEIRPRRHDASRAGQRSRGESRAASRRARHAVCDPAGDELHRGG